jgi:hypothetical protein
VLSTLPKGWKSWVEPPETYSYYLYIDPHAHNPIMVLFVCVDPRGQVYFYNDIFDKALISVICQQVKSVLGPRRLVRVRCDPIAFIEDPKDGTTWADDFWKHGLMVTKASKDLTRGIGRTCEVLRSTFPPLFTPACRRTIWEIGRYHWDETTNKPVDKDDHAMECMYRAVLDNPVWIEPSSLKDGVDDLEIKQPSARYLLGLEDDFTKLRNDEILVSREDLMFN